MEKDYKDDIIDKLAEKNYEPMLEEELADFYDLKGKEIGNFISQLDELYEEGKVFRTKKNKYLLPKSLGIIVGILSKHRKGFGFVIPLEEAQEDVFIGPKDLNYAMHGDLVAVKLSNQNTRDGKREGVITRILKRNTMEIVGTFQLQRKYGFVVSEDPKERDDIFVAERNINGAKTGDKVVVRITQWPEKNLNAEGIITEIISLSGEQGADIKALIRQHHLTTDFPYEVQEEADHMETIVNEQLQHGRVDLRNKTIITIDGADSKDFDDAVCVERLDNGNFLLGVHIADVSHYVKEGSYLDQEALKRGNSVYLLDQVIPMLPKELSNGICSLNPKVDRLTLSIDMQVNPQGVVINHEIYESIICSTERMVYTDVSDMLEKNDTELIEKYKAIYPDLLLMQELASILRDVRDKRGSLDFDFDEAYIKLNDKGIPTSVETAERRVANRIIEEFMLLANETIAEHFYWMEIPFVYRIHEKPALEKIEALKQFLQSFSILLKGNSENIHPRALNEVIKMVEGKPEEHVVNTVMLRSMKKAFYGIDCEGHFGLGVKYYCHFTSPIRRYPDLIIHRIIKESLSGKLNEKRIRTLKKKTMEAAEISSKTEREAQELEREVEKLKMAEYMSYHLGEEHEGIISGVAQFGFFVEIENTIEGMVRASEMSDDYYDYEPMKYRLIGRRTHKIYGLGDRVKIRVDSVNIANREINFTLC
ncbi:MAG: ribonuclease R [Anaerovorax sp.]|nr:ribonuclease R [Anaerovorax sp.]